jgi:hypothetical protein
MGLKHLKEQNPDLNINIIDLISEFDPTKTKKLTPFLLKVLKNQFEAEKPHMYWGDNHKEMTEMVSKVRQFPLIKMKTANWIFQCLGVVNVERLTLFTDYLERGLVDNKDISTYNSFQDIMSEIGIASTKEMLKKSKKDIMIVHDDDEWLFFKPLTHEAAITYGFGTKWCTSMKHEPEYFYRYSNQGVLIYVINKKTNRKFGSHSNGEVRIGIYDEIDNHIDSFETGLPNELIKKLYDLSDIKTNGSNYDLFTDSEKSKSRLYYNRLEMTRADEEVNIDPPIMVQRRYEPVENLQDAMIPNENITIPVSAERYPEFDGNFGDPMIARIIQMPPPLDIERIGNRIRTMRDQIQDSINDATQNEKFIDLP